jgi:hypothetical protein
MIPKNPLTMVGTIQKCWLFAFHTPLEAAAPHLPSGLELVTRGAFAFWNVVVCRVEAMRPKYSPSFVGVSYWHAAYRLYVRFHPKIGEPIEGLYFLRSDCDSKPMTFLGNYLTDFNFHTAQITAAETKNATRILIDSPDAPAEAKLAYSFPTLPSQSAFESLDQAAAFLKYKPFGISVASNGNVNIVKIVRDEKAWKSRLVRVDSSRWKYLEDKDVTLEVCYQVDSIQYQWNRGQSYARK